MEGYRPETYGDRIADVYDAMMADLPDPTDSVDRLAELAGPGPALELGIGTGRVALPLAARGVEVHGVDA
jgi:methylase of polypeptide subunit release factors